MCCAAPQANLPEYGKMLPRLLELDLKNQVHDFLRWCLDPAELADVFPVDIMTANLFEIAIPTYRRN